MDVLCESLSAVNVDLRSAPELVPVETDTMPLGLSHLEVEVKATDEGQGRSGVRGFWPPSRRWGVLRRARLSHWL